MTKRSESVAFGRISYVKWRHAKLRCRDGFQLAFLPYACCASLAASQTVQVDITPGPRGEYVRSHRSAGSRHRPHRDRLHRQALHRTGDEAGALRGMANRQLSPEHRTARRSLALEPARAHGAIPRERVISPATQRPASPSAIPSDICCRIAASPATTASTTAIRGSPMATRTHTGRAIRI